MQKVFLVLAVGAVACGDGGGISADERALAQAGLDAVEVDTTVVDVIELTLSGDVDVAATPAVAAASSGISAAARLAPAGCLATTVSDAVATHVLTGCTTPTGRVLSGTVVSTWTRDGSCLRAAHETTGFTIAGRTATGSLSTTICRSDTTETRARELTLTTTTRRDVAIRLDGAWEASLDTGTGCVTQSGTASVDLGGRAFERDDTGLTSCRSPARRAGRVSGTADPSALELDTLSGGELLLDAGLIVRVRFLGEGRYEIEDADGNFLGGTTEGTGI